MRLAILADIHGNLLALEAVLADLEARGGADALVIAGDLCLDGPRPREVLDRVRALGCPVVQGNTDRDLAAAPASQAGPTRDDHAGLFAWTRAQLGEDEVAYLRELPFSHRVDAPDAEAAVLVVHANPRNLDDHLRPLAPEETVAPYLADLPPDIAVVAFGHLHIPYTRRIGRITLADVSSVGLPKDGDRRAGYGLLTWTGSAWEVEQRRVEYPVDEVVAQLREANPPGVAELTRTLLRARYPNMAKARGGPAPRTRQPRPSAGERQRPDAAPPNRSATPPARRASARADAPRRRRTAARGDGEQGTTATPPAPPIALEVVPAGAVSQPGALALQSASERALEEAPDRAPVEALDRALAEAPADDLANMADGSVVPAPQVEPPATPDSARPPAALAEIPDSTGALAAPSNEGGPRLDPDQPFEPAARRFIAERFAIMMSHLDGVRAGDAEAVHDMRVASRRLRAALDAVEPLSKPKAFRRLYRAVKDLTAALGGVRDGDVLLAGLRKRLERAPAAERAGLAMLCARIEQEHVTHRAALRAFLDSWEERDVAGAFARFTRQAEPAAAGDADKAHAEETDGEGA